MESTIQTAAPSRASIITGWVLTLLVSLFFLFDAVMKLEKPKFVVDGTVKLGYQESDIVPLGVVLTLCTIIYMIPRTSMMGAILLTGYLGGAVASHIRAGQGWTAAFPVVFGILVWTGLLLRDRRLRGLLL